MGQVGTGVLSLVLVLRRGAAAVLLLLRPTGTAALPLRIARALNRAELHQLANLLPVYTLFAFYFHLPYFALYLADLLHCLHLLYIVCTLVDGAQVELAVSAAYPSVECGHSRCLLLARLFVVVLHFFRYCHCCLLVFCCLLYTLFLVHL